MPEYREDEDELAHASSTPDLSYERLDETPPFDRASEDTDTADVGRAEAIESARKAVAAAARLTEAREAVEAAEPIGLDKAREERARRLAEFAVETSEDPRPDGPDHQNVAAIESYTGAGSTDLNRALRAGTIQEVEAIAQHSNELSAALESFPLHDGTVFRGSATDLPQSVIDRYEPGETIIENQYLSTTRDANHEFGGNVLWVIESKTGRDVSDRSMFGSEKEVLLDRFSKFDVLAKDYDPESARWIIYMRELLDD